MPPVHNQMILNYKAITLHRRRDTKRAYWPHVFFKKLSLIALIKQIKNKSWSY